MENLNDETLLATADGQGTLTLGALRQQQQQNLPRTSGQAKLFSTSGGMKQTPTGEKEYKVLSQKDKWYTGKFDPQLLENALNDYAKMGYRVVGSATAQYTGFAGGNREEIIIILERDRL